MRKLAIDRKVVMAFIPNIHIVTRHRWKIVVYAIAFWLIIGFLVFIAGKVAHHFLGAPALDAFDQKQYLVRWVLWLLLTPLLILLGLKVNIQDYKIAPFILLHLLLGTLVLALDFQIEVLLLHNAAEKFYGRQVVVGEFLLPFLYKYFAYVINYFLIIGIVNIYVYMKTLQQTQKTLHDAELQNNALKYQLTLSSLKALRMQVHPHFLFNVHHSIIGLIINKDNEKAVDMLSKLSTMLRLSLDEQRSEFVSLAEELKIIGLYMDIQKVRFPDRLTYTSNVSPEASGFLVPYLLLQPLIENAVIYGVEQTDEKAFVEINARVDDDVLKIEIVNNYCSTAQASRKGLGIGISNVKERLQQYYGDKAAFSFTQHQPGTAKASLNIPEYGHQVQDDNS